VEAFEKIQHKGMERREAQALIEQRDREIQGLIAEARAEGYSMESIANAVGITRQQLYAWANTEA
jgi:hypothetical protein